MLLPDKLLCEYLVNPIGIERPQPRLSWRLRPVEQKRNLWQTAYQIRVMCASEQFSRDGLELVWDSGKVRSDQSLHVPYNGPTLRACQRYYWQVRVWDQDDEPSEWSEPAFWEMGLLEPERWRAKWITPDWDEDTSRPQPAPLLRRSFQVGAGLASARVYVTSLGLYELHINGRRVGDAYLTPGWSSYEYRLQYQTYDVSELLQEGENVLGALLGDGWYRGYLGHHGHRNLYGDRLALLLQLQLSYTEGRVELVCSDRTWHANQGPIRFADLYKGEHYDALQERDGWDLPGYDASDWYAVRELEPPAAQLEAQIGPLVRVKEELRPIAILRSPKGETILDFGQNMVGWVRVRVRGPAGSTISLRHAELLDQAGNLYTENLRTADQVVRYTLKGLADQDELFEPHFSFQGFRYVALEGLPSQPRLDQFTGVVIYSDLEQTGQFSCSNALINRLQENIVWSQKGNFVDVPTDCPQRDERLGWTGDALVFIRTACFNQNVAPFFTRWLRDLKLEQLPDGSVPYVVPDVINKFRVLQGKPTDAYGAAAWSDAAVVCPWTIYLYYGDTHLLEEQYQSMCAWVDFMHNQSKEDLIWRRGSQFGDWLDFRGTDPRRPTPVTNTELVATAYFAHSAQLVAQAAQVLGKYADASRYSELANAVKRAFQNEFVTPAGRIGPNSQTAYVLALHFDLLPEELRPLAAQRLAEEIRKANYHLTTGFVGTPAICHVLSRFGYSDLAYRLVTQEECPSWLYPVKRGATTIWERWDGIKPDGSFQDASMNSFNHYAYGAIGDWLYRVAAGLELDPEQPGFKRAVIQPQPGGGLTYAKASLETLYGTLASAWCMQRDSFELDVTVPPNCEALVRLKVESQAQVRESGRPLSQVAGIRVVREQTPSLEISIGSGSYRFSLPNDLYL